MPPQSLAHHLREVWGDGDAVLPLDPAAPRAQRRALLDLIRPSEVIEQGPQEGGSRRRSLGEGRVVRDGTALVVTTSGSTGTPKGVVLSHDAVAASTAASVQRLGARPGDRFAQALPVHHVAGLQVLLRSWHCDTEPLYVGDPGSAADLADAAGAADHVSLVPTQLQRLVRAVSSGEVAAEALAGWRSILVGGAHLDAELRVTAETLQARIVTSYGMTETCGGCVYDGRPLDGVEVRLTPEQRIHLRGPVLFDGYLDAADPSAKPQRPDPDGFVTNDLGRIHDDGRVEILGRADEVIISGGENVPAAAVATLLRSHPQVIDAAVVGVADPEWGARVVAVVAPAPDQSAPDLAALREHTMQALPRAYAPRQLVLVDRIPRDGMGKAKVEDLRALVPHPR